jgi:hypothetical protein
MKYIITEEQNYYLRRLRIIDNLIKSSLEMFDLWGIKKIDVDYMIKFLTTDVTESYFFKFSDDIYVGGEEYDELTDFIESYLNSSWRDKLEKIIKSKKGK